jgi:hypothetical protein
MRFTILQPAPFCDPTESAAFFTSLYSVQDSSNNARMSPNGASSIGKVIEKLNLDRELNSQSSNKHESESALHPYHGKQALPRSAIVGKVIFYPT